MNPRFRILLVLFILFMGMFLLAYQTHAAKPIAKISSFQGEVSLLSGKKFIRVNLGQPLKNGDRIQTKEGEVEITFNDGAVMKVRHFSSTMIQEREEKSGFWIFKTKRAVRRLTIFVGKLWFKSGVSKRKNYMQTPTAVCGVRGSVVEAGYDNVLSLLNVIEGLVDKVGPWEEGPFADPGVLAAGKNKVYAAIADAHAELKAAAAIKDPDARAKAMAEAEVKALNIVIIVAEVLKTNPDPTVVEEAAKAAEEAKKLLGEIIEEIKPPPPPPPPPPDTKTTEEEAHQEEASPSH